MKARVVYKLWFYVYAALWDGVINMIIHQNFCEKNTLSKSVY
jgi:hypothetical protein